MWWDLSSKGQAVSSSLCLASMWIQLFSSRPVPVLSYKIVFTVLGVLGSQLLCEISADPTEFCFVRGIRLGLVSGTVGINVFVSPPSPFICYGVKKKKLKAVTQNSFESIFFLSWNDAKDRFHDIWNNLCCSIWRKDNENLCGAGGMGCSFL